MSGNTCTIQGHEGQAILAVCVYEQCKKPRAVCFLCMQQNQHISHPAELKQIQSIDTFLNPKREQFSEIINKVGEIQQQFSNSINSLRTIVTEQYQPPNNFNGMGNKQIDQTVDKLTKYNHIQKLMSDRLDNIFKNTLEQIKTTCYDLSSPDLRQCNTHIKLGFEMAQNGNLVGAKREIDTQLLKNPKNTLLMLLKGINMQYLADILRTETLYVDAIETYERILSIESNNPWAIQGKRETQKKIL